MPDILQIYLPEICSLNVWTSNIVSAQKQLKYVLESRGREYPPYTPLAGTVLQKEGIQIYAYSSINNSLERVFQKNLPPLFFENQNYEFEFRFSDQVDGTEIHHAHSSIENAFRKRGSVIRGTIYTGNSIGWMQLKIIYRIANKICNDSLSFMIWPTKMDLTTDLNTICAEIDQQYPLWRFKLVQKTEHQLAQSRRFHERFLLLWLSHFRSLRQDLFVAVKQIIRNPHSRLITNVSHQKADRIKQRLTGRLEEKVSQGLCEGLYNKRYPVNKKTITIDTPENRFVKMVLEHTCSQLDRFSQLAREQNENISGPGSLSDSFFKDIQEWKEPFRVALKSRFFKHLGNFNGMSRESLVLHHRTGYAQIYSIWQQLKLYLDVLGRHASVSLKTISELYEVWCLLEIRRILVDKLAFTEVSNTRAKMRNIYLEKNLIDGKGATFIFHRESDDVKIYLSHEPIFKKPNNPQDYSIYSWTTVQKPDILFQVDFPTGERIRWIFDAKYRVASANNDLFDTDLYSNNFNNRAPDDAINQMHRYRDALILQESHTKRSRPIIGAFVLYPGWFDESNQNNPYSEEIESVGIGAFPCLPGKQNQWLISFLHNKLNNPINSHPPPDIENYLLDQSVRIPPTGLQLQRFSDLTLIANLGPKAGRDTQYFKNFQNGESKYYHIPVGTIDKKQATALIDEIRFFVPLIYDSNIQNWKMPYLYRVTDINIYPRYKLNELQTGKKSNNKDDYWLLSIEPVQPLSLGITTNLFKMKTVFVELKNLFKASSWSEIVDTEAVYKNIDFSQY